VDRFITLWEMAGEVMSDGIINEAVQALQAGGAPSDAKDVNSIVEANKELLTLHELIAHRLFQILIGQHRGRTHSI
jgi:xylose isomerase